VLVTDDVLNFAGFSFASSQPSLLFDGQFATTAAALQNVTANALWVLNAQFGGASGALILVRVVADARCAVGMQLWTMGTATTPRTPTPLLPRSSGAYVCLLKSSNGTLPASMSVVVDVASSTPTGTRVLIAFDDAPTHVYTLTTSIVYNSGVWSFAANTVFSGAPMAVGSVPSLASYEQRECALYVFESICRRGISQMHGESMVLLTLTDSYW
jgi:hypothetical protein